ncbi:MAG TPA: hypothetical protein PKY70_06660 [Nakamurella multipartita]|jgi:hypothetical protein|nr:hypothetical protein [Nakamurella multipartita]
MTAPWGSFTPDSALRPGRFDPAALIVVGLVRGAAPVLFVLGVMNGLLTVGNHLESLPAIATPMQAFRALLSPFAPAAVAVLLRFGGGLLALALAYPLSRQVTGSVIGPDIVKRPLRVWQDRLHLVRAYRSMRWTSPVRTQAIVRLGRTGYVLSWVGTILTILFWVSLVALLVVSYLLVRGGG